MASGYYEVGREVWAKLLLSKPWWPAVVVSSRPLRVRFIDREYLGPSCIVARIKVRQRAPQQLAQIT
jgi:hypothetical protein